MHVELAYQNILDFQVAYFKIEAEDVLCPCYREELLHSFRKGPFLTGQGKLLRLKQYIYDNDCRLSLQLSKMQNYNVPLRVFLLSKSQNGSRWFQKKTPLWYSKHILAEFMHLYFLKMGRNFKGIK